LYHEAGRCGDEGMATSPSARRMREDEAQSTQWLKATNPHG
jgi:hypothetical protein